MIEKITHLRNDAQFLYYKNKKLFTHQNTNPVYTDRTSSVDIYRMLKLRAKWKIQRHKRFWGGLLKNDHPGARR